MQPDPSGLSGLCHEPRLQPQIRRLLSLALVIVSSEDLYLLSLRRMTVQVHLHNFEVCLFGILLVHFFNAQFAIILQNK